jgi:hypothetical protein
MYNNNEFMALNYKNVLNCGKEMMSLKILYCGK